MFDFVEDYFKIENTSDYTLSIQVSLNGFSFCISQPGNDSVIAFKATPLKISSLTLLPRRFKEWCSSEPILQKHFQKIRLVLFSNKFTLVPRSLHQNQLNEELSYLLFKDGEQLRMAENLIESLDAKLLFALPDNFQQAIVESIGDYELWHPAKLMVKNLDKVSQANMVQLLFNQNYLYVFIKNKNKIIFTNIFTIKHSNDAVYYLLSTLKQFKLSTKETKLLFGGKSPFKNDSIEKLRNYFASCEGYKTNYKLLPEKLSEAQISENITLFL